MVVIGAFACTYENLETLREGEVVPVCDTGITYSGSVQPILEANCYDCHNQTLNYNGVILVEYDGVKRVADLGKLDSVINHRGDIKMPNGLPQLPLCERTKIGTWIEQGAPNN